MMTRVKSGPVLLAGLLAVAFWAVMSPAAQAGGGDTADLRQQVSELKQLVQQLNERVGDLQRQLSTQPAATDGGAVAPKAPEAVAAAPPPPPASENAQRQWHRIEHGMSTERWKHFGAPAPHHAGRCQDGVVLHVSRRRQRLRRVRIRRCGRRLAEPAVQQLVVVLLVWR